MGQQSYLFVTHLILLPPPLESAPPLYCLLFNLSHKAFGGGGGKGEPSIYPEQLLPS